MAIKSGPNAGRFLKKDDIGWLEVGTNICTDFPTYIERSDLNNTSVKNLGQRQRGYVEVLASTPRKNAMVLNEKRRG